MRTVDLGDYEFDHFVSNDSGQEVGQMSVTVLPDDSVYVRHIETFNQFVGKKIGLSSAQWLMAQYGGLPLTPVKETSAGRKFWAALRQRSGGRLHVNEQVSQDDLRQKVRVLQSAARNAQR